MHKLLKIMGAVAVINIVARLFGFLREVAIANQFGTSSTADAIITAYTIPNFIYLVVGGAFTTAFISVYHKTKGNELLFVRQSFTTILSVATALTVLLLILMDPLLTLLFRKMSVAEFELTRQLYRWMVPSSIFLVVSTWMSGLLNINGKYQLSSIAILLYNAAFVSIAVFLTPSFGALAYGIGALAAAVLMGLLLYAGIYKLGQYSLKLATPFSQDMKSLWMIALPILLGGASLQFYFVIHRIAADYFGEGAISAVNYASKLSSFPQAIMMTAVTTVIYPLLSKKEGDGDVASIRLLYRKGLVYLVALIVPATLIAYLFAEPIVRLVFGYGQFDEQSIVATVPLFRVFALSMFFLAANTYVTRFYYAKGNSIAPVLFSLISVFGINIFIMYLLKDIAGVSSIAYGTFVSAFVNFALLVSYARVKWKL